MMPLTRNDNGHTIDNDLQWLLGVLTTIYNHLQWVTIRLTMINNDATNKE
jgi:hypothetical protein